MHGHLNARSSRRADVVEIPCDLVGVPVRQLDREEDFVDAYSTVIIATVSERRAR
jgi:hypothetical protein